VLSQRGLFRVPTHVFEVHHSYVVIFCVSADTIFAGSVVEFAFVVLELIERVAVTVVGGVDYAH
jgi:hypothetical protein